VELGVGMLRTAVSFAVIVVRAELLTRGMERLESSEGTAGKMHVGAGRQVSGNNPPSGKALTT